MIEIDARHQPYEVADLDGGTLLGLISEDRVRRWKGARRELRLAYQWAVLNPPTADQPRAVLGEQCLYPDDADLKVSGEGTPDVAVFAVEDLSAAACISRAAALALIADTLDLHHRLPLLWSKVEDLAMPGWTARRVAELTRRLSFRAARWFDTELHKTGRTGWPTIERTLAQATVTFHPELVRDPRAPKSRDDWGVWVQHPQARDGSVCAAVGGTSELTAFGDSLDLARFLDLLTTEAAALAVLGDTGTLQQRRATALGRLAEDGQPTLGFDQAGTTGRGHDSPGHGRAEGDSTANAAAGGGTGGAPRPAPSRGLRVFAHLSLTDLLALTGQPPEGFGADPGDDVGIVSTDRLGQILTTQLRDWLRRHGSLATVAPVIDMARGRDPSERTDSHDPPGWLDTQVRLRDPSCVYPGCRRSSWDCDLDHIDPYVPPDAGGPPGQTRSENLAPLCRRHHLVKTTGRWRYRRLADGSYLWTNRHQQRWLVSPDGATPLE